MPGHQEHPTPGRPQPQLCVVPEHLAEDARTPTRFSTTKIERPRASSASRRFPPCSTPRRRPTREVVFLREARPVKVHELTDDPVHRNLDARNNGCAGTRSHGDAPAHACDRRNRTTHACRSTHRRHCASRRSDVPQGDADAHAGQQQVHRSAPAFNQAPASTATPSRSAGSRSGSRRTSRAARATSRPSTSSR